MSRHTFRPLDAVFGAAVVLLGVLVATFGFDRLDHDQWMIWFSVAAAVIGLALLPWPRRQTATAAERTVPDEPAED